MFETQSRSIKSIKKTELLAMEEENRSSDWSWPQYSNAENYAENLQYSSKDTCNEISMFQSQFSLPLEYLFNHIIIEFDQSVTNVVRSKHQKLVFSNYLGNSKNMGILFTATIFFQKTKLIILKQTGTNRAKYERNGTIMITAVELNAEWTDSLSSHRKN